MNEDGYHAQQPSLREGWLSTTIMHAIDEARKDWLGFVLKNVMVTDTGW
jgi:hypothetical protein